MRIPDQFQKAQKEIYALGAHLAWLDRSKINQFDAAQTYSRSAQRRRRLSAWQERTYAEAEAQLPPSQLPPSPRSSGGSAKFSSRLRALEYYAIHIHTKTQIYSIYTELQADRSGLQLA